jgi:TPR repeat protein
MDICKGCKKGNSFEGYEQGICPSCGEIFCRECTKMIEMKKCPCCKTSLQQSQKKIFKDLCKLRISLIKGELTQIKTFALAATLTCLSERYSVGSGTGKDKEKAKQMCREVVQLNNPVGSYNLYHLLVDEDPEQALVYLRQSAEMGFNKAQLILAMELRLGNQGTHTQESAKLLKQSALTGLPEAEYQLGLAFHLSELPDEDGDSREKREKRAFFWYERAAKQGHSGSLNNVALFYKDGTGCIGNVTKAISYFEQSIEAGCKEGGYGLGCIYEDSKDYKTAAYYYSISAAKGCAVAMFRLGLLVMTDKAKIPSDKTSLIRDIKPSLISRKKSFDQGIDMIKDAARHGHKEAAEYLTKLKTQLDDMMVNDSSLDGDLIKEILKQ